MKIKKYNEFLNEAKNPRGVNINNDVESKYGGDIIKLLKAEAPWYLENIEKIQPIFRGLKKFRYSEGNENYPNFIKVAPSQFNREAANTFNFYIELMDNSPYWESYPKRSESIICSTSHSYAEGYGDVFRVIPLKENSTFAVCSDEDIFTSFPYLSNVLKEVTKGYGRFTIRAFNEWLLIFGLKENDDFETIKEKINTNAKKLMNDDYSFETMYKTNSLIECQKEFNTVLKEGLFMYDEIVDEIFRWMKPDNNNFTKIQYNSNTLHSNVTHLKEVWTDVDCILIDEMKLQDAIEDYINWG